MKNLITIALVVLLGVLCLNLSRENQRLLSNEHSLREGITLYQTKANRSAASVERLTLELNEFKELHNEDRKTIEDMGIRLRRMESYAKSVTASTLRDTVILRDNMHTIQHPGPRSMQHLTTTLSATRLSTTTRYTKLYTACHADFCLSPTVQRPSARRSPAPIPTHDLYIRNTWR